MKEEETFVEEGGHNSSKNLPQPLLSPSFL